MNDYIIEELPDRVSSAFHTFSDKIRGKYRTVNWMYTINYKNNIPTNKSDAREFSHAFGNWIRDCESLVRENSIVIDIGAFTGDTTLPLAFLAGQKGKVLGFEPNPINYAEFVRNVACNPSVNIDPYNCAIMPESGEYDFLYMTDSHGAKNGGPAGAGLWTEITKAYPEKERYKAVNLEKLLLERYNSLENVSLVKCDSEGYDVPIILSMQNLIKKSKPNIIIEWLPTVENALIHLIKTINYKPVNIETREEIEITPQNRVQDVLLMPV